MDKNVKAIIDAIEDKKGENIVVIDMSKIDGSICDTFVICEAQSTTQVDAIFNEVEKQMEEKHSERPFRIEGRENSLWIILDYIDTMVHIFEKETRAYYQLEQLWADAPITKIESLD